MKVIRKKAITASSQIQSAENDKILFSDWVKKTYGINRDDIPSEDFDKYLNEYKEYRSGSNIVRYNYFEDIESSEDVTSTYKMKETVDKNRKYNEGNNNSKYLEIILPQYEEYFSSHPGYSIELLFGVLKPNDDRYQDIFTKLKEEGYKPRSTNYVDRIATDAITIDVDSRELPEDVWDIIEKYPELSIRHLNFHNGRNSYKAKFELWDEDFRNIRDKAYKEMLSAGRNETVDSSVDYSKLSDDDSIRMLGYSPKYIDLRGQIVDPGEVVSYYDVKKLYDQTTQGDEDPAAIGMKTFDDWMKDSISEGWFKPVESSGKIDASEETSCFDVYECMDDYTIGDKGQWMDEEELEIFYDQMKEDDPVVQEYDSFEAWLEDTVQNGYLRKVSEDEMLEGVEAAEEIENVDFRKDRRLAPTSLRYRGCLIVLDRGGDGYNVYDKYRELEDAGFGSLESAKKFVDELVSESNIKSAEETNKKDVLVVKNYPIGWTSAGEDRVLSKGTRLHYLGYEGDSLKFQDSSSSDIVSLDRDEFKKAVAQGYFQKINMNISSSEDVESDEDDLEETEQEFTSKETSINKAKLPAIYRMVSFRPNQVVLDYGGGRFDNGVEYLAELGATGLVYDPYNREPAHNRAVIRQVRENGGADIVLCSNVLNVIKEEEARLNVLKNIRKLVKPSGKVYITVYEGSGTGEGKQSQEDAYQLNRKTKDYMDEIKSVFPDAQRKGKLIVATPSGQILSSYKASGRKYTTDHINRCPHCTNMTLQEVDDGLYVCDECGAEYWGYPAFKGGLDLEEIEESRYIFSSDSINEEKYKVRFYVLDGVNKGDLDREEFFSIREDALRAYRKVFNRDLYSLNPTVWVKIGDDWRRLMGYELVESSASVQAGKLVEAPQEVVDELLSILEGYGFVLDERFKVNPGKTWFGNIHIQVVNHDSYVYTEDDEDVRSQLRRYVPSSMIDEIHALEKRTDCPITWNFGVDDNCEVTGGLDIDKQWIPTDDDDDEDNNITSSSQINLPGYGVQWVSGYAGHGVNRTEVKYFRKEADRDAFAEKLKSHNVIGIKTFKIDNFYHTNPETVEANHKYKTRHPNYCPHCTNMTLVEVEDGTYVCDECGAEYRGYPSFEGGLDLEEIEGGLELKKNDVKPYNTDKEHMMMFYVGPGGYLQKDILDYAKSKGHNYFYWGSDEAWSYDFHGGYNGDTIVTYDDADNLPDWYRDDAIRYGKPIKVNNNVASRIQAANYGGAYDIEDDMYFTKDEIVEFAQDVVDDFNTMQDAVFDLYSVYFVGDRSDILQIEITDGDYDFNHEERIDMRRIRKPSDLYKYKDKFVWGLIKEYKEFQDMMNGIEYVESSSTLPKRDLETLSKKAAEVTTIDDLNRVISPLRIHDENKWAHYSELARSGKYSPAAIGKMISDDLYQELQDEVEGSEKIEAKQKMSPWKVKKIIKDLNDDLYNKASKVLQSEDFGFPLEEIADYLVIEVEEIPEGIRAEVRAELSYSGMTELADALNPIVSKYDKNAYFDMVAPGIMEAYIMLNKQQPIKSVELFPVEDDYEEAIEDEKQYEVPFEGYVTVENDTIEFKSIEKMDPIEDEDYGYMKIDDQRGIEYNITELIAPNVPEEDGKYHVKGVAKLSYYLTGVHEEYEDTYDDYDSYKSYNTELATVEFNEKGSWIEDLQFVEE